MLLRIELWRQWSLSHSISFCDDWEFCILVEPFNNVTLFYKWYYSVDFEQLVLKLNRLSQSPKKRCQSQSSLFRSRVKFKCWVEYRTLFRLFVPTHLHQFSKVCRAIDWNFRSQKMIPTFLSHYIRSFRPWFFKIESYGKENYASFHSIEPDEWDNTVYIFAWMRLTSCNNLINFSTNKKDRAISQIFWLERENR
jgi:hypothetical protein